MFVKRKYKNFFLVTKVYSFLFLLLKKKVSVTQKVYLFSFWTFNQLFFDLKKNNYVCKKMSNFLTNKSSIIWAYTKC